MGQKAPTLYIVYLALLLVSLLSITALFTTALEQWQAVSYFYNFQFIPSLKMC